MSYLLDTNACIAVINDKPSAVRMRLREALDRGAEVLASTVVAFELWYGVGKSAHQEANAKRLEAFFAGPVSLLPFEAEDAKAAGKLRATMESAGKPIGAYDLLIAGQALHRNMTLVTANAREFGRIQNLLWEDWAKA